MAIDMRRPLHAALDAALVEIAAETQKPQKKRRSRLGGGRALLLGAGLMAAGRVALSSRGREALSSLSDRLPATSAEEEDSDEIDDEEDADEPQAEEADEEPQAEEADEEPQAEEADEEPQAEEDDEEPQAEEEPEGEAKSPSRSTTRRRRTAARR
jgi:hypothetical protein